jgi:hypothetical protein
MLIARVHFTDAIMTAQLKSRAWPDLASLQHGAWRCEGLQFHGALQYATQLTHLLISKWWEYDWPGALAQSLQQLQHLRSLNLYCLVPSGCPEPHLCAHLTALTALTSLTFLASQERRRDIGWDGLHTFARALCSMDTLLELVLEGWPSTRASAPALPLWLTLAHSLGSLRHLQSLELRFWRIGARCRELYFSQLGPALEPLRALTRLIISLEALPQPIAADPEAAAAANVAAGAALVHGIGSLAQLECLQLHLDRAVTVTDCCQHLASLTRLTRLVVDGLLGDVAPCGALGRLVSGMVQLERLCVWAPDAAAEQAEELARVVSGLPALRMVCMHAGPYEHLNAIAGRAVFVGACAAQRL